MPAGLNRWPATDLRFRRRTERLLEPLRDRGLKSEGLHGKNLIYAAPRKGKGYYKVDRLLPGRRPYAADAMICSKPRSKRSGGKAHGPTRWEQRVPPWRSRARAQRDDFAQHTGTIPKKT